MSKISGRVVVYPKDVQRLTGKSEKSSRMLLKKIKASKEKTEGLRTTGISTKWQ